VTSSHTQQTQQNTGNEPVAVSQRASGRAAADQSGFGSHRQMPDCQHAERARANKRRHKQQPLTCATTLAVCWAGPVPTCSFTRVVAQEALVDYEQLTKWTKSHAQKHTRQDAASWAPLPTSSNGNAQRREKVQQPTVFFPAIFSKKFRCFSRLFRLLIKNLIKNK